MVSSLAPSTAAAAARMEAMDAPGAEASGATASRVAVGDLLAAVNGESLLDPWLTPTDAIRRITLTARPLTLTFRHLPDTPYRRRWLRQQLQMAADDLADEAGGRFALPWIVDPRVAASGLRAAAAALRMPTWRSRAGTGGGAAVSSSRRGSGATGTSVEGVAGAASTELASKGAAQDWHAVPPLTDGDRPSRLRSSTGQDGGDLLTMSPAAAGSRAAAAGAGVSTPSRLARRASVGAGVPPRAVPNSAGSTLGARPGLPGYQAATLPAAISLRRGRANTSDAAAAAAAASAIASAANTRPTSQRRGRNRSRGSTGGGPGVLGLDVSSTREGERLVATAADIGLTLGALPSDSAAAVDGLVAPQSAASSSHSASGVGSLPPGGEVARDVDQAGSDGYRALPGEPADFGDSPRGGTPLIDGAGSAGAAWRDLSFEAMVFVRDQGSAVSAATSISRAHLALRNVAMDPIAGLLFQGGLIGPTALGANARAGEATQGGGGGGSGEHTGGYGSLPDGNALSSGQRSRVGTGYGFTAGSHQGGGTSTNGDDGGGAGTAGGHPLAQFAMRVVEAAGSRPWAVVDRMLDTIDRLRDEQEPSGEGSSNSTAAASGTTARFGLARGRGATLASEGTPLLSDSHPGV
jgi:hypothetical protein